MAEVVTGPASLPRGSQLILLVSQGPRPTPAVPPTPVPGLLGRAQGDALTELQNAGFRARVFNDFSTRYARGKVSGQMPREGTAAPADTEVVLLVSSGPSEVQQTPIPLPDVIGAAEADAVAKVQAVGLNPQVVLEYSPTVPAGIVMDQLPTASDLAVPAKKVSPWLWVALAGLVLLLAIGIPVYLRATQVKMVPVPEVVGLDQQAAVAAIEGSGFVAKVAETNAAVTGKPGEVVAQEPAGATEAPEGSTVTLSVVGAPKPVEVPDVVGLSKEDATARLEAVGLRANPSTKEDASVDPGTVVSQSPEGGGELAPGSRVDIVVASAPAKPAEPTQPTQAKVPDVVGDTESSAKSALQDAGFDVVVVDNPSADVDEGDVIAQLPTAGTMVAPGSQVAISVSTGAPATEAKVTVPNVIGKTRADAESTLSAAGLKAYAVAVPGTSETPGNVFAQAPPSGASAPKGSTVTLLYAE